MNVVDYRQQGLQLAGSARLCVRIVTVRRGYDAGGVEVVSIGPLLFAAEFAGGGVQYSVVAIVPDRGGKDFAPSFVMLDIAQDSFMASAYRIALIVGLEEFFGRVQIFGSELTPAKYRQKEWPSESGKQSTKWCAIAGSTKASS